MLTKGAIGNLINRYKAVLKKCHLINTFGSLAVASMLVMGGAGVAMAHTYNEYTPEGSKLTSEGRTIQGVGKITTPHGFTISSTGDNAVTSQGDGILTIEGLGDLTLDASEAADNNGNAILAHADLDVDVEGGLKLYANNRVIRVTDGSDVTIKAAAIQMNDRDSDKIYDDSAIKIDEQSSLILEADSITLHSKIAKAFNKDGLDNDARAIWADDSTVALEGNTTIIVENTTVGYGNTIKDGTARGLRADNESTVTMGVADKDSIISITATATRFATGADVRDSSATFNGSETNITAVADNYRALAVQTDNGNVTFNADTTKLTASCRTPSNFVNALVVNGGSATFNGNAILKAESKSEEGYTAQVVNIAKNGGTIDFNGGNNTFTASSNYCVNGLGIGEGSSESRINFSKGVSTIYAYVPKGVGGQAVGLVSFDGTITVAEDATLNINAYGSGEFGRTDTLGSAGIFIRGKDSGIYGTVALNGITNIVVKSGQDVDGYVTFDESKAKDHGEYYSGAHGIRLEGKGATLTTGADSVLNINASEGYEGANAYGIRMNGGTATIKGDTNLTATSAKGEAYGVYMPQGGSFTADSTNTDINVKGTGKNYGVYAAGASTVTMGGGVITVENTGDRAVGIYAEGGSKVSVTGKSLTINATSDTLSRGVIAKSSEVNLGDANTENITIKLDGSNAKNSSSAIWAWEKDAHVKVTTENLTIEGTVPAGTYIYGLHTQTNTDTDSTPVDERASLTIDAKNTSIKLKDEHENRYGNAIVALSNGIIDIKGNLTASADNVIAARGNAQVKIGQDGETVKLDGDIDFHYSGSTSGSAIDATVDVKLSGSDSYWKGNALAGWSDLATAPEDNELLEVNSLTIALNNGATWTPTKVEYQCKLNSEDKNYDGQSALSINNLSLNGGVIALNEGIKIGADNFTSNAGIIDFLGNGTVDANIAGESVIVKGTGTIDEVSTGALSVEGGALTLNKGLTATETINFVSAPTLNADITVAEDSALNLNGTGTINGNVTSAGTVNLAEGTVATINDVDSIFESGTINMNGQTLNLNVAAEIDDGQKGVIGSAKDKTLSINGGGTLEINVNTVEGTDGRISVISDGTHTINVDKLTINTNDDNLAVRAVYGNKTITAKDITINSGASAFASTDHAGASIDVNGFDNLEVTTGKNGHALRIRHPYKNTVEPHINLIGNAGSIISLNSDVRSVIQQTGGSINISGGTISLSGTNTNSKDYAGVVAIQDLDHHSLGEYPAVLTISATDALTINASEGVNAISIDKGTATFSGGANSTISGNIALNGGATTIKLGEGSKITGSTTVASNATLNLEGSANAHAISGAGTITNSGKLTVTGGSLSGFTGTYTQTAGSTDITKASDFFGGSVNINAGSLTVAAGQFGTTADEAKAFAEKVQGATFAEGTTLNVNLNKDSYTLSEYKAAQNALLDATDGAVLSFGSAKLAKGEGDALVLGGTLSDGSIAVSSGTLAYVGDGVSAEDAFEYPDDLTIKVASGDMVTLVGMTDTKHAAADVENITLGGTEKMTLNVKGLTVGSADKLILAKADVTFADGGVVDASSKAVPVDVEVKEGSSFTLGGGTFGNMNVFGSLNATSAAFDALITSGTTTLIDSTVGATTAGATTVSGGTFEADNAELASLITSGGAATLNGGKVTGETSVSGGTFTAANAELASLSTSGATTLTGGKVTGKTVITGGEAKANASTFGSVSVSGGTFEAANAELAELGVSGGAATLTGGKVTGATIMDGGKLTASGAELNGLIVRGSATSATVTDSTVNGAVIAENGGTVGISHKDALTISSLSNGSNANNIAYGPGSISINASTVSVTDDIVNGVGGASGGKMTLTAEKTLTVGGEIENNGELTLTAGDFIGNGAFCGASGTTTVKAENVTLSPKSAPAVFTACNFVMDASGTATINGAKLSGDDASRPDIKAYAGRNLAILVGGDAKTQISAKDLVIDGDVVALEKNAVTLSASNTGTITGNVESAETASVSLTKGSYTIGGVLSGNVTLTDNGALTVDASKLKKGNALTTGIQNALTVAESGTLYVDFANLESKDYNTEQYNDAKEALFKGGDMGKLVFLNANFVKDEESNAILGGTVTPKPNEDGDGEEDNKNIVDEVTIEKAPVVAGTGMSSDEVHGSNAGGDAGGDAGGSVLPDTTETVVRVVASNDEDHGLLTTDKITLKGKADTDGNVADADKLSFTAKAMQVEEAPKDDNGKVKPVHVTVDKGADITLTGGSGDSDHSIVVDKHGEAVEVSVVIEKDSSLTVGDKENKKKQQVKFADVTVKGKHNVDGNNGNHYGNDPDHTDNGNHYGHTKVSYKTLTVDAGAEVNFLNAAVHVDDYKGNGGKMLIDPAYVSLGFGEMAGGTISDQIIIGSGSVLNIGGMDIDDLKSAALQAGFALENETADSFTVNSGKAVVSIGTDVALGSTGSLSADGSQTAGSEQHADKGNANFAANSLLVVKAGSTLSGDGTLTVAEGAKLSLVDLTASETPVHVTNFTDPEGKNDIEGWTGANLLVNRLYDVAVNTDSGNLVIEDVEASKLSEALPGVKVSAAFNEMVEDNKVQESSSVSGIAFLSRATHEKFMPDTAKAVDTINEVSRAAVTAGVQNTALRISDTASNTVVDHMSLAQHDGTKAIHADGVDFWAAPMYGNLYTSGMVASGSSVRGQFGGLALGADLEAGKFLGGKFRLGAAINGGGGQSETKGGATSTQNDYDFGGLNFYAAWTKGAVNVIGSLGYGFGNHEVEMGLPSGMEMGSAKADIDTSAVTADLRAEYQLKTDWVDLLPHVGVRYTALHTDAHDLKANGSVLNSVQSDTQHIVQFPIGVTFTKDFACSGWNVKPMADVSVIPAAGDKKATTKVKFSGLDAWDSVNSRVMDSTSWAGTIGVQAEKGNMTFGLNYGVQASSHETDQNIQLKFGWKF